MNVVVVVILVVVVVCGDFFLSFSPYAALVSYCRISGFFLDCGFHYYVFLFSSGIISLLSRSSALFPSMHFVFLYILSYLLLKNTKT